MNNYIRKILRILAFCTIFSAITISVNASTSDALIETRIINSATARNGMDYDAPFIVSGGNVDTSSGAVIVKEVDLSLPGKNGFDLNIYRQYSSYNTGSGFKYVEKNRDSYCYKLTVPYDVTIDGEVRTVYVAYDNENEILEYGYASLEEIESPKVDVDGVEYLASIKKPAYKDEDDYLLVWNKSLRPSDIYKKMSTITTRNGITSNLSLGNGWRVNIPHIYELDEYVLSETSSRKVRRFIAAVRFEDGNEESLKYDYCHTYRDGLEPSYDEIWEPKIKNGYNQYTAEVYIDPIEDARGFKYNAVIETPDGKKYYFIINDPTKKASGKIVAMADRYENTILYEKVDTGWLITDTYGRKISVSSSGIQVTAGDIQKSISYETQKIVDEDNNLSKYYMTFHKTRLIVSEDNGTGEERQTVYTMQNKCIDKHGSYYDQSEDVVPVLLGIQYPTNARKEFVYEEEPSAAQYFYATDVNVNNEEGDYFYYRVANEKLYEDGELKTDKSYQYTGQWYNSEKAVFQDYKQIVITEVLENGHTKQTTEYYDSFDRAYDIKTTFKNGKKTVNSLQTQYNYFNPCETNSSSYVPTSGMRSKLRSAFLSNVREYEDGKMLSSTDSKYDVVGRVPTLIEYGESVQTFSYDTEYWIPKTKTINQISKGNIREVNTLTSDNKSIAKTEVYEGSILKESAEYTYNTDGTMASYTLKKGNKNIVTEYDYQYNSDSSYSVTETIKDVEDADGNKRDISISVTYDSLGRKVSETDGNGNITRYEYNSLNQLTKQINPDGSSTEIAYDIYENSVTETDENGNITTIDFSPLGNEESVYLDNDVNKKSIEYTYDNLGRKVSETIYKDEGSTPLTYEYEYDNLNQVVKEVTRAGNNILDTAVTSYEILEGDIVNLKIQGLQCNIDVSDYKKAELMFFITGVNRNEIVGDRWVSFDGEEAIDDLVGKLDADTYVFDISDVSTIGFNSDLCSYTVYIRLLKNDADEDIMGGASKKITTKYTGDSSYVKPTTVTVIDGYGNKTSESFYDGEVSDETLLNRIKYKYDLQGNVIETHGGRTYMENLSEYTTRTEYDYAGRPLKEYRADGKCITNEYDKMGNKLSTRDYMGYTTRYEYDAQGRQIRVTTPFEDSHTASTLTYYDNNGNIIKVKQQNNKLTEEISYSEVEYEYDNRNRLVLTKVNDGTQDIYTQYEYDAKGNVLKEVTGHTEKLTSLDNIPNEAIAREYEYDRYGNITKETDAEGKSIISEYNDYGLLNIRYDKNGVDFFPVYNFYGSIFTLYVNDPNNSANREKYRQEHNKNNMLTMTWRRFKDENVYCEYTYDKLGRVNGEIIDYGESACEYTNDVNGNRRSLKVKQNGTVVMTADYTYDVLDRLTNVTFDGGESSISYAYDDNGNILSETVNGEVTEYVYNKAGLLKSQRNQGGSEYALSYGLDGNIVSQSDSINGVTSYVYDGIGQLKSETLTNGEQTLMSKTYNYDSLGNRISMTENGKESRYTYDKNNRLLKEEKEGIVYTYTYDNNGNLVCRVKDEYTDASNGLEEELKIGIFGDIGEAESTKDSKVVYYRYDGMNRLQGIETEDGLKANYVYDISGRRLKKNVNGEETNHIWDGENIVRETDGEGTELARYYMGRRVSVSKENDVLKRYQYDPHGSVVRYGTEGYTYDAYGNELTHNNSTNPFRYCGEYYDNETGFIYLRNRYYDSSIGRFITEDPAKDGLNWYAYCGNNPVMFVDPSGLEYLVVSGSEEDNRYKYNFIETALKKINELKSLNNGEWITWIVSKTAYSNESLSAMNDIAYELGVGFVTIDSASEFQNYVNSQDVSQWELSHNRLNDPIKKVVFFSHGIEGSVELGYGQSNQGSLSINGSIVRGMNKNAFEAPNTWFYSCNGATGGNNSIAKQWYDVTNGFTGAYIGKTNYQYIMYPKDYSSIKKMWNKKMRDIDNNIDSRRAKLGFSKTGSDYYPIPSDGTKQKTWG